MGTLLILAISVMGVAAVMVWGAPTVQKIQDRNALVAMVQEFEDLRHNSLRLTVADSSYFPTVVLPDGTIEIVAGSRIMVTANVTEGNGEACPFHVHGWSDAATPNTVEYDAPGPCGNNPGGGAGEFDFEVWTVSGASVTRVNHSTNVTAGNGKSYTNTSLDFTQGDWLFQITNVATDGTTMVFAEAWLFSTDQIRWNLQSGERDMKVITEGGMIFSYLDGTYFLERWASIQEAAFETNDTVIRLPAYKGSGTTGASGQGGYSVFLGLEGNHLRNSTTAVDGVRYDFQGDLAESWCNSLVDRNQVLDENRYVEDASYSCASGDADGVRSVLYRRPTGDDFPFEFVHAIVNTNIAV